MVTPRGDNLILSSRAYNVGGALAITGGGWRLRFPLRFRAFSMRPADAVIVVKSNITHSGNLFWVSQHMHIGSNIVEKIVMSLAYKCIYY